MEPHKLFFRELRALFFLVLGIMVGLIGVIAWKEGQITHAKAMSIWLGTTAMALILSLLFWPRKRSKTRSRPRKETSEPTMRNPQAQLPPLRQP